MSDYYGVDCAYGLVNLDEKYLSKLTMDLIKHPDRSWALAPTMDENIKWLNLVRIAFDLNNPEKKGVKASLGNICPPGALIKRLEKLWLLGSRVTVEEVLLRSVFRKDEELVLQLIEKFPQINFNPKSRVGTPILHRLAYQGPDNLFKILLDANVKKDVREIFNKDKDGLTPFQWAIRNGSKSRAKMVLKEMNKSVDENQAKIISKKMVEEFKCLTNHMRDEYLKNSQAFILMIEEKNMINRLVEDCKSKQEINLSKYKGL